MIKHLAVFCGSNTGQNPDYIRAAQGLAFLMHREKMGVVYGGGRIGLMGIIADAMLDYGGEVIGVIPKMLMDKEVGHMGITKLHVVDTMHDRKALMAQLSDGFVALPGGIGTLEEIIEVFTWLQIGYHNKPCAFLNTAGYFNKLFDLLDHMVAEGFLGQVQRDTLIEADEPEELIEKLKSSG